MSYYLWCYPCHYKYNSTHKKLDKIFEFTHFSLGLHEHGAVHLKSQNKLLLFGGYDHVARVQFDDIWEYDLSAANIENKWVKYKDIKLPMKMSQFAWVLTKNEDYIIIFAGYCLGLGNLGARFKNILILDLKQMKFYSSKIKMTGDGYACAVLMYGRETDDRVISGYIRNIQKEYDMIIPSELMTLFELYLKVETIYAAHHFGNK